jgi:phosphoglycerate dehydrogenase-like enzyme
MTKVFCNAGLSAENLGFLREEFARLGGVELVLPSGGGPGSNLLEGPSDPGLISADVAFGQPNVNDLLASRSVRLVQLTSAGWARYEREDLAAGLRARGGALCTASWVYQEPCAEHVVAFMLAQARQLPGAFANQAGEKGWPVGRLRAGSRLMVGQRVVLLGYGTIAARVAELLAPFRMEVVAFRRKVRGDEVVATRPIGEVERYLGEADHVVNILPGTPKTAGFMNAARFAACRAGAVYYNIGRGTTTDQTALLQSLESGRLAAAYLDVTDPEPLPPGHGLWTAKNCFITPHTAGGYVGEGRVQVEHLIGNLRRWRNGEGLVDRVV